MSTTAKIACGRMCLMTVLDPCDRGLEMCLPGECSAWEWDTSTDDGAERRGHCVLMEDAAAAPCRNARRVLN